MQNGIFRIPEFSSTTVQTSKGVIIKNLKMDGTAPTKSHGERFFWNSKFGDYGEDGTSSYGVGAHPSLNIFKYRSEDGFGRTNRAVNVKLEDLYINAWRPVSTTAYTKISASTTVAFANGFWPGPNGTFEAKNIYCRMRDPLFNTWTALPVGDRFGGKIATANADPSSVKLENMIIDYRGAGEMSDPAQFSVHYGRDDQCWLMSSWPGRSVSSSSKYTLLKNIYGIKYDGTYFVNESTNPTRAFFDTDNTARYIWESYADNATPNISNHSGFTSSKWTGYTAINSTNVALRLISGSAHDTLFTIPSLMITML